GASDTVLSFEGAADIRAGGAAWVAGSAAPELRHRERIGGSAYGREGRRRAAPGQRRRADPAALGHRSGPRGEEGSRAAAGRLPRSTLVPVPPRPAPRRREDALARTFPCVRQ